jgi:SAM-dependent methyltransferase
MSDRRLPGADLRTLLRPALSTGSSAQVLAEDLVPALLAPRPGATVVDLGCGRGDSVDVVFCKQVLEHVEQLDPLVADVARVLRPDGVFAGSTSHLEPYHGRSTANVTPYGMQRLLDRCGLELEAIMPGIDGPTLIARRLLRGAQCFDRYWARRSPFNTLVDGVARVTGWDAEDRTALKLLFCGQYAFVARPRGRG